MAIVAEEIGCLVLEERGIVHHQRAAAADRTAMHDHAKRQNPVLFEQAGVELRIVIAVVRIDEYRAATHARRVVVECRAADAKLRVDPIIDRAAPTVRVVADKITVDDI